jgi:hypothetical protein
MQKKYVYLIPLLLFTTGLFAQLSCPNFKIRGNKSPRSQKFTNLLKVQADVLTQYQQDILPQRKRRLDFYPALSAGLEHSFTRHLSVSATYGWTFNSLTNDSRILSGDIRYYFDQCFENKWLSARLTATNYNYVENDYLQPFMSIHYGKTAKNKYTFTHYEIGIGFGLRNALILTLGASTSFELN